MVNNEADKAILYIGYKDHSTHLITQIESLKLESMKGSEFFFQLCSFIVL